MYDLFVCRVTGKISITANERAIIIEDSSKWRFPTEKEENEGYCEDDYGCDYCLVKKRKNEGKLLISEEQYEDLTSAIENIFGRGRISRRVMGVWSEFWEKVDEWVDDRENDDLINYIKKYLY